MLKYFVVDAFTSEPFGGNPAGVVLLDDDFPSEELMRQVAAELRYSETVFVLQQDYTEFSMRYFTPHAEVDLCGHATIAAFHVLLVRGKVLDYQPIVNHTRAGDLMVKIDETVMMQMALPKVVDTPIDSGRLHRVMAGENRTNHPTLPVEIVSTGLPDIIMPVPNLNALNALRPDMTALTELSRELDVVGVHAFTLADDGYTAHVRNFAPRYDIPEESATGTANAALTHYLAHHGLIGHDSECCFIQGEAMGRPSVVLTALHPDGTVWVGGDSRIVAEGSLMV